MKSFLASSTTSVAESEFSADRNISQLPQMWLSIVESAASAWNDKTMMVVFTQHSNNAILKPATRLLRPTVPHEIWTRVTWPTASRDWIASSHRVYKVDWMFPNDVHSSWGDDTIKSTRIDDLNRIYERNPRNKSFIIDVSNQYSLMIWNNFIWVD